MPTTTNQDLPSGKAYGLVFAGMAAITVAPQVFAMLAKGSK